MDNKQYTCDPCSLDAAIQDASSFCVVCVERLCDDFVKFHGKNKATYKHKILTGDDVPINTDTFRLLAESAFCKTHPEREIQFKCEDHDEYICGICARTAHRRCEHMEEIGSDLDENKVREECQLTINHTKTICDKLSIATIGKAEIIENDIQGKRKDIEERRILFQSIPDLVTKLETKTCTEINILYDDHINTLRGNIENITTVEQQQINDKALLDATLKYADTKTMQIITNRSARQLAITQKTISDNENKPMKAPRINKADFLKTLIKDLEEEVESKPNENHKINEGLLEKEKKSNEVDIHGSDEYASCMQEDILRISPADIHLGENKETSLQLKSDFFPKQSQELHIANEKVNALNKTPLLKQPTLKQTMSLMERSVRLSMVHQYDVLGNPSGCVFLQDGRLVTIGVKLGRPTMSVYNTNIKAIFESLLGHEPFQICSLGKSEVAITYSNYKRIDKFLVLKDKIEKHGCFQTKLYGRGITKHGNDIAVLFADVDGHMEVYSNNETVEIETRRKDGKITDTIREFEDQHGKELVIKDPDSILSLPNEDILVGDKTHLRCFNMYGYCRWFLTSYKDHALKQVMGMTIDREGNILVCGYDSNNVHQLCSNNNRENRVLISEVNNPACIAYDAEGERIIIGCGDCTIKVFKFV